MGNKIKETENNEKTTTFAYDNKGRMVEKTDPNGVTLFYTYNHLDQIITLTSSDNTVNYQYIYDPFLSKIKDHTQNTSLTRTHTPFGETTSETYTHTTSKTYDNNGRVTKFTLPDNSAIEYTYENSCLKTITRHSPENKKLYTHSYDQFDCNKHIEKENLIYNLGSISSEHDLLERPTKITSPYHTYGLTYGPSGLVTKSENSLTLDKTYNYDSLNQLISEGDTQYHFDSLGNPSDTSVNHLNQITQIENETLSYDKNGNLIRKGDTKYTYDALNRLIKITTPEKTTHLDYDPLSRLTPYLYDGELEIGKVDPFNNITELKVLGIGIKGDIGGIVALEINNKTYAPLHDLQGNLIALISTTGNLVESYNLDAFGNEEDPSNLNPWRFSSKRHIDGLIFFGKRFYSPTLKRFISPDPLGFADGLNLYTYVSNSPLNRLDLLGLIQEFFISIKTNPNNLYQDTDHQANPWLDKRLYVRPYVNPDLPISQVFGPGMLNNKPAHIGLFFPQPQTINFTAAERTQGFANLFDHSHEFMYSTPNKIGQGIFSHGINNSIDDFNMMGTCLANTVQLPFIGLYTPTKGLSIDGCNALREIRGSVTNDVLTHVEFLKVACDLREEHNPEGLTMGIIHSRTGATASNAYQLLKGEYKETIQNDFYYAGLAPATPLLKELGHAINIYSKKDNVTLKYGKKFLNNKNYDIRLYEPVDPKWHHCMTTREHSFLGPTLQKGLKEAVDEFNEKISLTGSGTR